MTPNSSHKFGFDILTERKKSANSDDDDSYEKGEYTRQNVEPYTDDAIILQSILEYSIEFGTENYFKSRQISENHLLKKCDYYTNKVYDGFKARTNMKSRVEEINPKVIESLEKLTWLELVDNESCVAKNGEPTRKYRFTKLGRMIALLLLVEKKGGQKSTSQFELYKQVYDFYCCMKHSHAKFCLIFFETCYFRGKFHQIAYSLTELLKNNSGDKYSFLNQLRFLNLVYRDLDMWNIFLDSLDVLFEVDEPTYYVVLFNLKLVIEDLHQSKCRHLKEFEVLRLKNKQDVDKSVIGGYCNNCQNFYIVIMETLHYLDLYIMHYVTNDDQYRIRCISCNEDYIDFQIIV